MAEFKLKTGQERFRVVDGPFKGRLYEPYTTYDEIPPIEKDRFEEIIPAVVVSRAPKKAEIKEEGDQS